jgi:osmotically-inducible protein OsmY
MTLLKRCSAFSIAASLLFVLGCGSTATRESTGQYFDDSVITSKVKTAILNEPSLKVLQINVETYKNIVQLSGFVSTGAEMDKAVDVAGAVQGVRSVKNDMRFR